MKISDIATSTQLTDDEYLPIWTALMESARGRRFLSEFARRTRSSETRTLLDAVQKLEHALIGAQQQPREVPPQPVATAANDAAHDLRAAITQAVPELETASRINLRSIADVQDAADDIHAAASAMRTAAITMAGHEADAVVRACDTIDLKIIDLNEIIVVQQIADERVSNISAELAELVTAPAAEAQDGLAQHAWSQHGSAPNQCASGQERPATATSAVARQPQRTAQAGRQPVDQQQRPRATEANSLPQVADMAPAQPAAAAPASHSPAVQQLIHEITARLLNGQDNRPAR